MSLSTDFLALSLEKLYSFDIHRYKIRRNDAVVSYINIGYDRPYHTVLNIVKYETNLTVSEKSIISDEHRG